MLTANDIKYYASLKQKKYRGEHKKFLIEGFHLIEECLSSPYSLEYIIVRNDVDLSGHPGILQKISQTKTKVEAVPEGSFNKLAETENSQGVIGVVSMPENTPEQVNEKIVIALDRINDPGNLGTIIRTAYWFNAGSVLVSSNSADIYNSKVLRSSQGAVFHTDIKEDVNLAEKLSELKAEGYDIYLFTLDGAVYLDEIKKTGDARSVLVFGSEAHGISDEISGGEFEKVKIRGYSNCESLNAAISCAIALYKFSKPGG